MLLKKLTLSNFRQFKDTEIIEFSQDKHANITLILGDNTSGKTTILQSLLWCFYGKASFKTSDQLYNEENAKNMKENETKEIYVSVDLEHAGVDFVINRTQLCKRIGNKVELVGPSKLRIFTKNDSGIRQEVRDVDVVDAMNDILPEDLSEYFFYDTERFGNITEKKDVTNAVKGLLGLTILENAIDHLGRRTRSDSVIGRFYNDLNHDGNKDINKIHEDIYKIDQQIANCKSQIEQTDAELENYHERLEEKEEILRSLAETMTIQNRIDELRLQYESNIKKIEEANNRFLRDFRNNPLDYFINPLLIKAEETVAGTKIEEDFIPGMNASSIDSIIERGYCVCGNEIKEGSKEFNELQNVRKVIPPQSIGGLVSEFHSLLNNNIDRGTNFFATLNSSYEIITNLKYENQELDHQITKLEEKIKDIDNAKRVQAEVDNIRKRIDELKEYKIKLEKVDLERFKEALKKKENELASHIKINEQNKEVLTLLKYAEKVAEWFQKDFDARNNKIRTLLEEKVNHYFQSIYHGNRRVNIDDKYRVTLLASDDDLITDESAGLETVKNFAFIAGLVDLAKEKLEDDNKKQEDHIEYSMQENYPLVLDAPFSNVDEKHVINIAKVLPTVAAQLILIVMEKDWNYASEELESKVGQKYLLDKKSEIYTKLRGVN